MYRREQRIYIDTQYDRIMNENKSALSNLYSQNRINKAAQSKSRVPNEWTPIIELQNNNDII